MNDDDDKEVASADQDAWIELAQAARGGLVRLARGVPEMSPGDAKVFIDACRQALVFERDAVSFDQDVHQYAQKTLYSD